MAALTARHRDALDAAVEFLSAEHDVDAILLKGSWARGVADPASDVDVAVLTRADPGVLERAWEQSPQRVRADALLRPLIRYSTIEVEAFNANIEPSPRGWTSGPDDFEVRIGNWIAYAQPLWERRDAFAELRRYWLPYYDDELRGLRLDDVVMYCRNNLDHIPWSLKRGDRFHAFNRLYHATLEFVQALFIAHRTYPIAYDKWLEQQLHDLLGLPEVAGGLAEALSFESIANGQAIIEELLTEHVDATAVSDA